MRGMLGGLTESILRKLVGGESFGEVADGKRWGSSTMESHMGEQGHCLVK